MILLTVVPDDITPMELDKAANALHGAVGMAGLCSEFVLVQRAADRKRTLDDLMGDPTTIHYCFRSVPV